MIGHEPTDGLQVVRMGSDGIRVTPSVADDVLEPQSGKHQTIALTPAPLLSALLSGALLRGHVRVRFHPFTTAGLRSGFVMSFLHEIPACLDVFVHSIRYGQWPSFQEFVDERGGSDGNPTKV